MGYIKHHAIVVTGWQEGSLEVVKNRAKNLGLQAIGPSTPAMNGYYSILICPDGSKEGWDDSDLGDIRRSRFLEWLDSQRYLDRTPELEWVEVSFSNDDRKAEITNHAWTKED